MEFNYQGRKKWFEKEYWANNQNDIYRPNGITRELDLNDKLFILLKLIKKQSSVIDLGCGNGLLLKRLVEKSPYKIIPYGVDWIEKSINQAKTRVLKEFGQNFEVANVVEFEFKQGFDVIITDPECVADKDFKDYFGKCFNGLNKGGILIWFIPADVYERVSHRKNTLKFLQSQNMSWLLQDSMATSYLKV